MPYLQSKGLGKKGHVRKTDAERVLTQDQWRKVLQAVEDNKAAFVKTWKRDYTALYLGMMFGCRISEVILLERRHFTDLESSETAHIPTLKQSEKIRIICNGQFNGAPCGRRVRVRMDRAGDTHYCPRCNSPIKIPANTEIKYTGPVERDPPVIEEAVIAVVSDYLKNCMRPDQRWLFESKQGRHISASYLSRIFNTYCHLAGLSNKYSFHSLRHGRGVTLWSRFQDIVLVQKSLRQKSVSSAQVYIGLDPEKMSDIKKKLNRSAFNPLARKADNAQE